MVDVTDPVCGMEFPEQNAEELGALKETHEGQTYWFCCPECHNEFVKDPAQYV